MQPILNIIIPFLICVFLINVNIVLSVVDKSISITSALTFQPPPSPPNSFSTSQTNNLTLALTTTTTRCTSETFLSSSYPNLISSPKSHHTHSTSTIIYTCDCDKNSTSTIPPTTQTYSANETYSVILTYSTTTTKYASRTSSTESYPNSPLTTWSVYPNSIVTLPTEPSSSQSYPNSPLTTWPVYPNSIIISTTNNASSTSPYLISAPSTNDPNYTTGSSSNKLRVSVAMGWDIAVVVMGLTVLAELI
jgi:hypothetical protein